MVGHCFLLFFLFFFHFSEMGIIIARDRITIFALEVYFNVRKNFDIALFERKSEIIIIHNKL